MDPNTIFVFDKGYNDYKAFKKFSDNETGFVTRIKDNAVYEPIYENEIDEHIYSGVLQDEIIELTVKEATITSKLKLRKIRFYDRVLKREFEFLTNLFEMLGRKPSIWRGSLLFLRGLTFKNDENLKILLLTIR